MTGVLAAVSRPLAARPLCSATVLLLPALAVQVRDTTSLEVELRAESVLRFTGLKEGKQVLGTRDAFVASLSPFDRQARLKTDQAVSEERFLAFAAEQVLPWKAQETAKLEDVLASVREKLSSLKPLFPETVLLIKTSGREEGHTPYTRSSAIILPQNAVDGAAARLERLLIHELFHILTRHKPRLRDQLYRVIGFERRGNIELPADLKRRKITNPDAPRVDVSLEVTFEGKRVHVAPVLFSTIETYDVKEGGEFFSYLTFRLLAVEQRDGRWAFRSVNGKPLLLEVSRVPSFYDKVGRNTRYILHPEETLADNFVFLVQGKKDLPTPRVIDEMRKLLEQEKSLR